MYVYDHTEEAGESSKMLHSNSCLLKVSILHDKTLNTHSGILKNKMLTFHIICERYNQQTRNFTSFKLQCVLVYQNKSSKTTILKP